MGRWEEIYPQSFGLLPLPFGGIVLPYVESWQAHIDNVLSLRFCSVPEEWVFLKHISDGKLEEAVANLEGRDDEVSLYNSVILSADEERVKEALVTIKDNTLKRSLDAMLSVNSGAPYPTEGIERRDLLALIYLMNSSVYASSGKHTEAMASLDEALKLAKGLSPVFEAHILLRKAILIQDTKGASYHLIQLYTDILDRVKNTEANYIKLEAHFQLGNLFSTFGNVREALSNFHKALSLVEKEKDPYMWALIHNNVALAYLSIPATDVEDQVRLAMGVQHLKKALSVFTKDIYPSEWASATLNYANALQYLPTSNPVKNLVRAVELYEEVLSFRKEKGDVEGYARTLANMGNALAHLGKLKEAEEKLLEARSIFSQLGAKEECEAIDSILREIKEVETGDGAG